MKKMKKMKKLYSYSDLILERALNESNIYYSPELKDLLGKMRSNDIARELLEIEGTNIKPDITYLDFGDEGFLTFTTMKNATKKLIDKGISDDLIKNIEEIGGEIGMGYTDSIKIHDGVYGIFSKSRNPLRINKLINKIFPGKFTDAEKEDFVNKFKAKLTGSEQIMEIVQGDDIKKWYDKKNYAEEKGQLGNSCMRSGNYYYFNIYSENPEVCRMVILKDDDKIIGRALLWKIKKCKGYRIK
jgi:hypothetical protein